MPSDLRVNRAGQRLDQFLVEQIDALSRGRAQQLIEGGHVLVFRGGGHCVPERGLRPSYRLQCGDLVRAALPPVQPLPLEPEPTPLVIVYEDGDMLVLDKPAGMVVHPAPGHAQGTLVQALLARYPDLPGINGRQRPGIVHRLDKDTSGLLMVAKNERAHRSLSEQLAGHRIAKGYLALVSGRLEPPRGLIDAPIGRDPSQRQRMAVTRDGRTARTGYVELGSLSGHSLALAVPESGRTHQIRVHFSAIGRPLVGDRLYAGDTSLFGRQFLHASSLRFARPSDGRAIECESTLPPDLLGVLRGLAEAGAAGAPEAAITRMLALSGGLFREMVAARADGPRPSREAPERIKR